MNRINPLKGARKLLTVLVLSALTFEASAQMNWGNKGFWTLGADKQWTDSELDRAFTLLKRLKEAHGDQFQVVVQDLRKEGATRPDGTKTAQIVIKIFVDPSNAEIETELKDVGLTYVR